MISPGLITDREVVTSFDDNTAFRWGVHYQGPQYLPLFARWFDELWASIPDSYLIYSRNGFNQSAIDGRNVWIVSSWNELTYWGFAAK